MPDFVRAKSPDGQEFYTSARAAKARGAKVVDENPYDVYGRLPAIKPNIHKGGTLKPSNTEKKDG